MHSVYIFFLYNYTTQTHPSINFLIIYDERNQIKKINKICNWTQVNLTEKLKNWISYEFKLVAGKKKHNYVSIKNKIK